MNQMAILIVNTIHTNVRMENITDQDSKFMFERKLRFTQPDYTAEELLDNVAELKLKHDTAYAVSLEKEY